MPPLSLSRSRQNATSAGSTSSATGSATKSSSPLLGALRDLASSSGNNGGSGSSSGAATPTGSSSLSRTSSRVEGDRLRGANHIGSVIDDWPMYSSQPEDYVLGDVIGYGASSTVFQASFLPLHGRACAVKVIDLEAFGRDTEELRRETQLMSLSKHPNVLRVRGCWVKGTKLHIATRLMSSGSLLDIMRFAYPDGFPEEVICTVLKQALQGLSYLHINGWLHRDLKAGNLLVDEDGTVLLGDFGVGVWVGEGRETGKRKSFVGTPCWMAPEVVERKHYNAKADIWSFGITALELAQGHAPHSRLPPVKVLMKTLQEEPPQLDTTGGAHKYSKIFADFVRVCLQKDPDKRPSADKLLKHAFFKHAKQQKYLVTSILSGLPPLSERQEGKRALSIASTRYQQSWDFGVSPSPSILRTASPGASARVSPSNSVLLKQGTTSKDDPFSGFTAAIASPGASPWNTLRSRLPFGQGSMPPTPGGGAAIVSIDGEHAIAVEEGDDGGAGAGAYLDVKGGHARVGAELQLAHQLSEAKITSNERDALGLSADAANLNATSDFHFSSPPSPTKSRAAMRGSRTRSSVAGSSAHRKSVSFDTDYDGGGEGGADAAGTTEGTTASTESDAATTVGLGVIEEGSPSLPNTAESSGDATPGTAPDAHATGTEQKLRIAMVSDFFYPNVGGVEGHIAAVTSELALRGHHVVILTHAYTGLATRTGVRYISLAPGRGITVYYLPVRVLASQDTLPNFFTSHPLMRQVFLRERIQIVHAHAALSSLAHEAILHARPLGIRTVFTDHSLFSIDEDVASVLTNKLLRFVLGDVERVVCVSFTGKENTMLRGHLGHGAAGNAMSPEHRGGDGTAHVSVIPNAVDAARFRPLSAPPPPPPGHRLTIVVLSRLTYRKGIDLLLDVIPAICRRFPHVDFLIGGDGPKRVDLEQMRERHLLLERVRTAGAVRGADVRRHLAQGHVFLSPSLTEAFGTSLVEAASCGLLVVATAVGGVPEVLPSPELMLLAEPSSEDLVRVTGLAITRLTATSGDAHTRHDPWRSHEAVRRMYDWASVTRRLERVYMDLLGAGAGAGHNTPATVPERVMQRLERHWARNVPPHAHAHNNGEQEGLGALALRMPVAAVTFLIVVMVDIAFSHLLEYFWPAEDIEVVPDGEEGSGEGTPMRQGAVY